MQLAKDRKHPQKKHPHQPLSNVQLELLKLYSMDLANEDLVELKIVLSHHFANKAISEADASWKENNLSADDMNDWLNGN